MMCIAELGVSIPTISHLAHLNMAVRDIARPLTAPSLSNVTLLLMKSIEHPKQRIKATRMSSTITIRRNHSNTFLRRER